MEREPFWQGFNLRELFYWCVIGFTLGLCLWVIYGGKA